MAVPDGFFWGCGASAVGVEGAAPRSDWFRWERRQGLDPSADGNGFAHLHSEDFELYRSHGLRHVRITVEWARVEPEAGGVDSAELERVVEIFRSARDASLNPWVTLHHGSLPGWFADDTDGFRTTAGPSIHWSRHVDRIAELLDGLVTGWIPVEDPIGWALRGHLIGTRPPGLRSIEDAQDALEGAVEATFEAWKLLSSGAAPVVSSFAIPMLRSLDDDASSHATWWDEVVWRSWTEAIAEGVLRWPWRGPVERPELADAFTAIGVRAEPPVGITAAGSPAPWPANARVDGSGFAPDPEQFGEALRRVDDLVPGRDLVVTGLGVGTDDDAWRDDLHAGWLEQISAATADGLAIRGAFFEPGVDGYEFDTGFSSPRGIFTRDREPKPSFRWIEAQQ